MKWYSETAINVLSETASEPSKGLKSAEALKRLNIYGKNKIEEKKRTSIIIKFFMQFNDFMVIVLLIAAAVSFVVSIIQGDNDFFDSIIILIIVILNALLGVIQESRAEKALEELKKMSAPSAKVIRDSKVTVIGTENIVKGDIILLEAGDFVPADARLITSVNLKADESNLTGESLPSEKNADAVLKKDALIGDRINMVFSGSSISMGRGTAVVVETGMNTEMGKIATLIINNEDEQTPLQKKLDDTGKILGTSALIICFVIFILGLLRHLPFFDMFITSVSLAVAAIPEGLPAIVTIMLAIGVQKMAKSNAVVRRLPAVETLGSATVICSDKTGTLTQNKMKVVEIVGDKELVCTLGCLCNDASVEMGEPTEKAIVAAGIENKINKQDIDLKMPRVFEIPFSSERKLMSTVHKTDNGYLTAVKGAFDVLIKKCSYYCLDGKEIPIDDNFRKKLSSENMRMAGNALRVLACAYKNLSEKPSGKGTNVEKNLVFAGLIGMMDPPRAEVKQAVATCRQAGIKPVMITGDHVVTAKAIGRKIGIMDKNDLALTGEQLSRMSQEELCKNIYKYSIFARVSPEHKVRIVKAFKERGEVVAMTGDGVNDAPALKSADIGCAMGLSGTDVAKGASDMVLTDDNFATIVEAVKVGRGIFSNIKKSVHFLLSSNIGEILTILTAILIGFRTPLLAIHLLWVNLVTDSLPAIALGLDPVDADIMERKPYKSNSGLFSPVMWFRIALEGMMIGMLALIAFGIGCVFFDPENTAMAGRTMAFATLSISQLVHAFNMRSDKSIFTVNILSNIYLIGSLLIGVALQAGVIMIKPLAVIFKVVSLSPVQWLIIAGLCIVPIVIVEIEKFLDHDN